VCDTSAWLLQFHGNALCDEDVFLSNGVLNAPAALSMLAAQIIAASTAAAAGGGPVITVKVFGSESDCSARGTDNMQLRFASGRLHEKICPPDNVPAGPSRLIHIEQRRDVRRAPNDPAASRGKNRGVLLAGIVATFP
jgi:hypothetical protein